jgi:hypothetical protein
MPPVPERPALSGAQEELRVFERLAAGGASCTVPVSLWLEGPFDAGAARRALDAVVERHDALRTVLDGLRPRVLPRLEVDLPVLAGGDREAAVAAARDLAAAPFPAGGPLVRAAAWRMDGRRHLLSVVVDHVVFDGASISILLDELAECYSAAVDGRSPRLPACPPSFHAAVAAERAREASGEMAAATARLAGRLRDVPDVLQLDLDRAFRGQRAFGSDTVDVALGPDLTGAVLRVAREERCTAASVLLAAFALLVARCAGTGSVAVSVPVANRTTPEELRTIGLLANAVPTPLRPSGCPTFRDLLRQARDALFFSFDHGHVPFQHVVRALRPGRPRGRPPLCQVEFVHTGLPAELPAFGPLRAELLPFAGQPARYDLSLDTWQRGPRLTAAFAYAVELLSRDRVEALRLRFERILHRALLREGGLSLPIEDL